MYGVCQIPTFFATVFGARGRESLRPSPHPAPQSPCPSCSISRLARRAGPPRCAHTAHELPVCGGAHPPPTRLSHPDCLYPQVHGTCGLLYIRACVRARVALWPAYQYHVCQQANAGL